MILHCGAKSYIFEPNIYLNYFLNQKYKNKPNARLYQKPWMLGHIRQIF